MPDVPTRPSTKVDERWERWVAKGVAHDDDARHRAKILGVLILSTVALTLAVTLGLS
jgi:hypothetical protein